ncbi:hypothetical protein YQE_03042, partial [Dendroctonus ponderosae]
MKFLPVLVLQLICSFCLELSQYEYSEILHHEDRRSIVRDTKSVFWPELEDLENTERCKRQEQPVFDSGDFRILDEEHVNLTGLGIVPNSWPEISNASNERNGEQEDRSVLRVQAKLFYQSCMDELSISKRANQPLADVLQYLGGWPIVSQMWAGNREDLFVLLARKD